VTAEDLTVEASSFSAAPSSRRRAGPGRRSGDSRAEAAVIGRTLPSAHGTFSASATNKLQVRDNARVLVKVLARA
jgi:hypothetical protein